MNESTLVPLQEMSDLDWLVRNVHEWPASTPHIVPAGDSVFEFGVTFCENHACVYHSDYTDSKIIYKKQWLARRAELQNKPSWGSIGSDINFISQHEDGQWIGHSEKPDEGDECFECDCIISLFGYGEVLGDWRNTLENRPADLSEQAVTARIKEATDNVLAAAPELMADKYKFEPFVSVEDAATAKQPEITPSKYTKTIRGVSVDVYDVLQAWGVSNPALQHLIKKALQCGQRGHKDNAQDLQDIIDSAIRAKELGL